jgi:glycerol-3-phosphate dehydrogenase (NAD+)
LLLARKGHRVDILVRKKHVCDHINQQRRNPLRLTEFEFPPEIRATTSAAEAFEGATYMCHAVPVQFSRAALTEIKPHLGPDVPILSLSKGIEQGSLSLMCDLLGNVLGPEHPMAFLSGPAFAKEIAGELATAVVIASNTPGLASEFGEILNSDVFRCYYPQDVVGVEIGGAVKNVIALAAGMCEGLGLGTNAMAALVTRGCSEVRAAGRRALRWARRRSRPAASAAWATPSARASARSRGTGRWACG